MKCVGKRFKQYFILIKYEYKNMKENKQICYKIIPQIGVEQIEGNEMGLLLFVLVSELIERTSSTSIKLTQGPLTTKPS
jgi:hypothetical protein